MPAARVETAHPFASSGDATGAPRGATGGERAREAARRAAMLSIGSEAPPRDYARARSVGLEPTRLSRRRVGVWRTARMDDDAHPEKKTSFSAVVVSRELTVTKSAFRKGKKPTRESRPYFTHKKMQSRIFTKNRPLKVFKIRRIEWLFRTSVGILLARGRAFPFGVSVIPPRAPPPRTPHLHMSANALAARPPAPAVGRRAVLPSFRRAARAAAPRAPAARGRRALSVHADERLNVVFVGAECAPFSKTGGLGESRRLAAQGASETSPSRTASTRPSRADARESASRSVSPQRQKCQLSGRSPDSQHDERHSGRRAKSRSAHAPPPPPLTPRSSRRSFPIRTHTNAFIRDSLPLNPRRHSCSAGTG